MKECRKYILKVVVQRLHPEYNAKITNGMYKSVMVVKPPKKEIRVSKKWFFSQSHEQLRQSLTDMLECINCDYSAQYIGTDGILYEMDKRGYMIHAINN